MSLLAITKWCLYGFKDSVFGTRLIFTLDKKLHEQEKKINPNAPFERKLLSKAMQCIGAAVFIWIILCAFINMIPFVQFVTSFVNYNNEKNFWMKSLFEWIFSILVLAPFQTMLRLIASIWFNNVSTMACKARELPDSGRHLPINSIIADVLYTIVFEIVFGIQSSVAEALLSFNWFLQMVSRVVHQSLIFAMYACEYKWFTMNLMLNERVHILTTSWPYYLGFGLPMHLLNELALSFNFSSYDRTALACSYLAFFPFMIVSGTFTSAPCLEDIKNNWGKCPIANPSVQVCEKLFGKFSGWFKARMR